MRPLEYFEEARRMRRRMLQVGEILKEAKWNYSKAIFEIEMRPEVKRQFGALYRESA